MDLVPYEPPLLEGEVIMPGEVAPDHPNCRCDLSFDGQMAQMQRNLDVATQEVAERLAKAAIDRYAALLTRPPTPGS